MNKQIVKSIGFLLLAGTLLPGCAAMKKSNALDNEKILSAAGFKMKVADTPDKLAHVKSMKQRKLLSYEKDGAVYYAYADAEYCKCLYMGTEKNYQEYQRLSIEQNTAEMNEESSMNWGPWGGWSAWGPWYEGVPDVQPRIR